MTLLLRNDHTLLFPITIRTRVLDVEDWARCIRALNDAFRLSYSSTELYCSPEILKLDLDDQEQILQRVRDYRSFDETNDPNMIHNWGHFQHGERTIVWEIYCTENEGRAQAVNPTSLDLTQRHMMILLAEEWWNDLPESKT